MAKKIREFGFLGGPMDGAKVAWAEPRQWVVYVSPIRPVGQDALRHTYVFMGKSYWHAGVGMRVPAEDYHDIVWVDN